MGLYNIVFGHNPFGDVLLKLLGFKQRPLRYRDALLEVEEDKVLIKVLCRQGGGNRECACWKKPCKECNNTGVSDYQRNNEEIATMLYWISDKDTPYDTTYNIHIFDITSHPQLEHLEPLIELARQDGEKLDDRMTKESWERAASEMASDMKAGRKINPQLEALKKKLEEWLK